ncbi:acyl-CoA carboxylase subunit epsilon [Corynebacterium pseudodiphtheriticum]|uniref:acyl-CoA carboxylase subunit epsilon n=1 Tax=Corynebacterium pseudodiphtheriticum TaxID=37637 RepID=UPI0025431D7D|nr:acyl-CoA carboxylase subunit epsilon [Corynebacterium pseudodiphtheriticum]MDK4249682.1 acyl-CoA carboxylase subunit epsilon [Corynebacterium pseudodiphtheriticum]
MFPAVTPTGSPLFSITKGNPSDDQLAALSAIVSSLAARPTRTTATRTPQTRRLVADIGREYQPLQFPHVRFY